MNENKTNAQTEVTPQEVDAATMERALILETQAETIKAITGVDVLAEFNDNDVVRDRILHGEIDFIGLYNEMENRPKKTPTVVRNANNPVDTRVLNLGALNSEQFRKLDQMLASGTTIDL